MIAGFDGSREYGTTLRERQFPHVWPVLYPARLESIDISIQGIALLLVLIARHLPLDRPKIGSEAIMK
jgi:hypothetical protein